ncbi:MAG: penicillin-binding transpeptidase domain-containing protein [bacterium]|nr:penicillin-binding transpeptidase domain-containing protein [bacterium]
MKRERTVSTVKYRILVGAVVFVFSLLSLRLADLQLVRGNAFLERAEDNKSFQEVIARRRGVILDRFQDPIAFNDPAFFVRDAATLFAQPVRITQQEALEHAATASTSSELVVGMQRTYPFTTGLSHVLGYVGGVSAEELQTDQDLLVSDSIGKFGLERQFEKLLRGEPGAMQYLVDARGRRLGIEQELSGKPGQTVTTSLDPYLSTIAAKIMGELQGSVIISDPKTGQILTLLSSPSFDANLLTTTELSRDAERERRQAVQAILTHPKNLFFNRAIAGAYPPGSVFKLVTAIAGLESNAISADTVVDDIGILTVNDFTFANWYYTQFGRTEGLISLQRAISRSNDIYFYKAAEALGPDRLAAFARLFGFGAKSSIELGGEVSGLVPDPEWKEQTLGERWFLGNTYHYGIGQGLLLVTPLQVAQMTASIANKGVHCPTTLLGTTRQCEGLGVSQETLEVVVAGMLDACSAGGTAFPLFAYNERHRAADTAPYEAIRLGAVACKTGTAEFGGNNIRGHKATHAWFSAILGTKPILEALEQEAPSASGSAELAEDAALHREWKERVQKHGLPETLAITVLVESDEVEPFREGSRDAAPVVAKLLEWMEKGVGEGEE